ncbi:hypothetical protein [Spirillospora sp. NPDC029432]|uniref:hypothetical protein n=1 Tax=Spirillospora sp. NPDC029432 TaxID=3154599 RepID=UPI00345684F0
MFLTSSRRGVPAVLVACTLVVSGCGIVGARDRAGDDPAQLVRRLRSGTFGTEQVDVVVGVLRRTGVGVYDDFGTTGGPPIRLTEWQARNLAAEAAGGGGRTGAEINAEFPTAVGMPPIGFVVNAWLITHRSEAARFARALLGEHDWRHPERIVYPRLVFTLFLAEAAKGAGQAASTAPGQPPPTTGPTTPTRPMPSPPATSTPAPRSVPPTNLPTTPAPTVPGETPGPSGRTAAGTVRLDDGTARTVAWQGQRANLCAGIADFVSEGLNSLARFLKVDASGGGAFVRFLASIWNAVVDLAAAVVKGLIRAATAPVVDAIGGVLTAIGFAYQLSTLVKEWNVRIEPVPSRNAFGIGAPNTGRFKLTVGNDRFEMPTDLETCAQSAGLDLVGAGAPGSTVTWTTANGGRPDLATKTRADETIGKDRTAYLTYNTGTETAADAQGTEQSGLLEVRAMIRRGQIERFRRFIVERLLKSLDALPEAVRNFVRDTLARPAVDAATDNLAKHLDVKGYGVVSISYHVPEQPTPPSPRGRTGGTTPPAGDLCSQVGTGTYTGTLDWTSTATTGKGTVRHTGTGPISFTIAADGTVSGTWSSKGRVDSSGTGYDFALRGGAIEGRGCRPQLSLKPVTWARDDVGVSYTLPGSPVGSLMPQLANITVSGRALRAANTADVQVTDGTAHNTVTLTATR